MTRRTPVQIGSTLYPSTNQARLVYSAILNKYPEGRRLDKPDTELVKSLMTSSEFAYPFDDSYICITQGSFGKHCFASVGSDKLQRRLSIMSSLRRCATGGIALDRLK